MSIAYIIDEDEQAALLLREQIRMMGYFSEVKVFKLFDFAHMTISAEHPAIAFISFDISLLKAGKLYSEIIRFNIPFVCVTSVPDVYMTAVDLQAFDYLLKPFQPDRLEEIVQRYIQYIERGIKDVLIKPQPFHEILLTQKDKIMVNTLESINLIAIESIIKVEGVNNYSRIYTKDEHILMTSKTLKYFENQLYSYAFVRAHKSHLVNLAYVDKILSRGGNQILLKTGERICITREKKAEIKNWFKM